jgi:hypothetical protein
MIHEVAAVTELPAYAHPLCCRYLAAAGLPEVLPQFQALEGRVQVDEDAIRSRIKADNAKRAAAGGGGR